MNESVATTTQIVSYGITKSRVKLEIRVAIKYPLTAIQRNRMDQESLENRITFVKKGNHSKENIWDFNIFIRLYAFNKSGKILLQELFPEKIYVISRWKSLLWKLN